MAANPSNEATLAELQDKTLAELQSIAKETGLKKVSGVRKKELIRMLLEEKTRKNGLKYATGVLEVLPEGYGFLRSPGSNYLPDRKSVV